MGREILVGEWNLETVESSRVQSGELQGEWC